MSASLRAVIFDVDGTLVDSERHGHRVAFNKAFEEAGLPDRWSEDDYGPLLKVTGGKERLTHYLTGRDWEKRDIEAIVPALHERKNEVFLDLVRTGAIPARAGVARLLEELEREEIRLAIATTGSKEWVEPLVEGNFGADRFEVIVTGDDVGDKKPDPAAYRVALERLQITAGESVAIEDSLQGVRSATAARLPCVAVTNGYTEADDLTAAALVISGFGDPGEPEQEVHNPHEIPFRGTLTADVIQRLHRVTAVG